MGTSAEVNRIDQIRSKVEPLRAAIAGHPLYDRITGPAEVQVFMQHHVYAVWDFMSLLKSLQNALTCTRVPWVPVGTAETRYLINEIVCGEESDVDPEGRRMSHFEMYLSAMEQAGASTSQIRAMLKEIIAGAEPIAALKTAEAPVAAREFVDYTFQVIAGKQPHVMASVFTFGREDLIPQMFYGLVRDLGERFPDRFGLFQYYLQRHIEVDGDHHSLLAIEMVNQLCGDDPVKWQEAESAAIRSLECRLELWNAIEATI
jgi:hypothetical protein